MSKEKREERKEKREERRAERRANRKDLDIKIDGKKLDIHIKRENGTFTVDIDGEDKDLYFEKNGKFYKVIYDSENLDATIETDADGVDVDVVTNKLWILKLLRFFRVIKK